MADPVYIYTYILKAIIKPIPKNAQNDPRVPLNYRGVSLLSTVSKLFSGILNNRLVAFLDSENLLVDEQNGFRKSRACIDHIFILTTIMYQILFVIPFSNSLSGWSIYLAS